MKRFWILDFGFWIACYLLLPLASHAQTVRVPNSNTLPTHCTAGDTYQKNDAGPGAKHYACTATDTWEQQGGNDAALSTSDVTTNNVSTSKHGFTPKAPNDASKYLDGTGAWTVPAGGSGGMTLVEAKTITSNSTTVTFSGLTGNSDITYLLQGKLINSSGTGFCILTLRPNGATTNQHASSLYWDSTTIAVISGSTSALTVGFFNVNNTWMTFEAKLYAKKNPNSVASPLQFDLDHWFTWDGTKTFHGIGGGEWTETSTEMTSLDVVASVSNCISSGSQLFLYKYAH